MFVNTVLCGQIALGKQGENLARKIAFDDALMWVQKFGEGRFELLHQRNGDEAPYPVVITVEDGIPYWYVSASDTAVSGVGQCELRYIIGDRVVKSQIYNTYVAPGLCDETEVPEPQKAWVDQVYEAVGNINSQNPYIGENGNWFTYDAETNSFVDSGVSSSGTDGATPEKGVDYFTEDDVASIVNDVLNALPNGDEVSY